MAFVKVWIPDELYAEFIDEFVDARGLAKHYSIDAEAIERFLEACPTNTYRPNWRFLIVASIPFAIALTAIAFS